jgi:hypothetical protein
MLVEEYVAARHEEEDSPPLIIPHLADCRHILDHGQNGLAHEQIHHWRIELFGQAFTLYVPWCRCGPDEPVRIAGAVEDWIELAIVVHRSRADETAVPSEAWKELSGDERVLCDAFCRERAVLSSHWGAGRHYVLLYDIMRIAAVRRAVRCQFCGAPFEKWDAARRLWYVQIDEETGWHRSPWCSERCPQ